MRCFITVDYILLYDGPPECFCIIGGLCPAFISLYFSQKPSANIADLSLSSFGPIRFWFTYFTAMLFGACIFRIAVFG